LIENQCLLRKRIFGYLNVFVVFIREFRSDVGSLQNPLI